MADKKEHEPVNPKWLLRRISETLPSSLPEELVNMIIALYAHSNAYIKKEDAECGRFEFSVTVPFSQLATYTRLTSQGVKKRCERLRDDWKILSWVLSANRNHGNDFSIRWGADESVCPGRIPADGAASGGVLGSQGGVAETQGGVLEGSGGVPARTPSVLSVLSGKTITITNVSSDKDEELKTAGETPATPTLSSSADFTSEAEFDESMSGFGEPASSSPVTTQDFAVLPSWETEPARWLANYLLRFLYFRADVEVLPGWEKFWTNDFQEALNSGWSLADLGVAIQMSQFGKAREYYRRGASIVRNLELLVNNGQKLQERGLLVEVECHSCSGLFVGDDAFEHVFDCYRNKPADPQDVADEEAMYLAEELASEGYVKEPPDMQMFYPWPPDDMQMFYPWDDVPEQLPEPTGEQVQC